MIALDKVKISHLQPFNSIVSIKNSFTTISPQIIGNSSGLIVRNVEANPGIYQISIHIYSQSVVYWKGTYEGNNTFRLQNGTNIFKINIDRLQTIDLSIQFVYSLDTDRFSIYHFSIEKIEKPIYPCIHNRPVVNRNYQVITKNDHINHRFRNVISHVPKINPVTPNLILSPPPPTIILEKQLPIINPQEENKSNLSKLSDIPAQPPTPVQILEQPPTPVQIPIQPQIQPTPPIQPPTQITLTNPVVEKDTTEVNVVKGNGKKNILLVADTKDWCFYNTSVLIRTYLGHKFNIHIECYAERPNYKELYPDIEFDIVVRFWYGFNGEDPFELYPNAKKAICIYDYIYWNANISQNLHIMLPWFLKTLDASDYVLYSCPAIRETLIQQIKPEYYSGKIYPIYDGYDPKKFFYKEYNNNTKLVVGWAGNIKNIFKRFDYLKETVQDVDWIELKLQDRSKFIPHSQMVHYYHSVDVIVCLSDAEGTPTPVLEASASGRAWISTNVGICGLINNVYDTKIKPGIIINDKSELLSKLRYLHENRKIMQEMGMIGWMSVNKAFTWDVQMNQFEAIFDRP